MINEAKEGLSVGVYVPIIVAVVALGGTALRYITAPANVAIDNVVFHESQQYNDSMARDLDELRLNYASATTEGKVDNQYWQREGDVFIGETASEYGWHKTTASREVPE